ncbi:hypothetical protein [Thioalkalivibrio sp. AKL10]|uniref:hypothetical protein n=1 Tax=Thioalkalivibrio sp. AKL10 TaxID=1158158 RepID=UPI0012DFD44C|nr:hypothetical protein [Thioalkalivibrio sp. AKL10]
MSGEYKTFIAKPVGDDGVGVTVYCHGKTYNSRLGEVEDWIKSLMNSQNVLNYEVEVQDSTWAEATLKRDGLFETHFGGK